MAIADHHQAPRGGDIYACACLLALNGLRVGELCATNVEDLGESTWHHTLTLAPRTVQAISLSVGQRRSGLLMATDRVK